MLYERAGEGGGSTFEDISELGCTTICKISYDDENTNWGFGLPKAHGFLPANMLLKMKSSRNLCSWTYNICNVSFLSMVKLFVITETLL
jgi:hypothetical protein